MCRGVWPLSAPAPPAGTEFYKASQKQKNKVNAVFSSGNTSSGVKERSPGPKAKKNPEKKFLN